MQDDGSGLVAGIDLPELQLSNDHMLVVHSMVYLTAVVLQTPFRRGVIRL